MRKRINFLRDRENFKEYRASVSKYFKLLQKMKIEKVYIEQIKSQFAEIKTKEDLASLLNNAKNFFYKWKDNDIEYELIRWRKLVYYANPKVCKNRYRTFTIKKKSGEDRIIHAPARKLKSILCVLNFVLHCIYKPHKSATGFVLGKSIVDNAKKHVGYRYVYNIDLKDFFYSFDRTMVKKCFMNEPFNLKGEKEPIAFLLASLCTHPIEINGKTKFVLPQGSPTSPILTNILCKKLDRRLDGLAKRFGAVYTRYADDITFSSHHNIYNKNEFLKELKRIIEEDQKLSINLKKVRLQKSEYRQNVTGLVVNEKVNVNRMFIKRIRMWLYYWEKYGYQKANQIFKKDYVADKGHVKDPNAELKDVVRGKLEFVKMVRGAYDPLYLKLNERFEKLTQKNKTTNVNELKHDTNTIEKKNHKQKNNTHKNDKYPKVHNPKKTVEILKYFSANDKELKYTTHSWEKGRYKSYEDFMNRISKEWKTISKDLYNQNRKLFAKINAFLFKTDLGQLDNKNGNRISWGEKKLHFGWSSPELKEFMKDITNDPFSFPIPDYIRDLDEKHYLSTFKDYADVFKNEIEFREDSQNLIKTINKLWQDILNYDFNLEGIDRIKGISFYTDVQWISETLKIIFKMFSNNNYRHNYKIEIEVESSLNKEYYHLLKITQVDSFVKRSIKDPKIQNPTGDLGDIIDKLKNLCDYSIISEFKEGNYRINYLVSEPGKQQFEKLSENVKGFCHELKFYL